MCAQVSVQFLDADWVQSVGINTYSINANAVHVKVFVAHSL